MLWIKLFEGMMVDFKKWFYFIIDLCVGYGFGIGGFKDDL